MVITCLGKGFKTAKEKRAKYNFDNELSQNFSLKKANYTNMLPLLIDNFRDKKIVPIFTKEAQETQLKVLEDEFSKSYISLFDDKYFIKDTKDFSAILKSSSLSWLKNLYKLLLLASTCHLLLLVFYST